MRRNDLFRTCIQNLLRRKSRTFLTVLGVVIGCCSIVVMASIGFGMREAQERLLSRMGDLTIITVTPQQGGRGKQPLDEAAASTAARQRSTSRRMPVDSTSFSGKSGRTRSI